MHIRLCERPIVQDTKDIGHQEDSHPEDSHPEDLMVMNERNQKLHLQLGNVTVSKDKIENISSGT